MKFSKIITYPILAISLLISSQAQAAWISALGIAEAAQEASGPDNGNGLLKRLSSLYEATKSLAENTRWLSDSINYVGRKEVVDSLNHVGSSINYVGRPETLQTLNDLSQSAKDLSTKGVKINTESLKEITLCGVGAAAALSGIGIITYTALKDDAKNARTKYLVGVGLTALGITSVLCSNWLHK